MHKLLEWQSKKRMKRYDTKTYEKINLKLNSPSRKTSDFEKIKISIEKCQMLFSKRLGFHFQLRKSADVMVAFVSRKSQKGLRRYDRRKKKGLLLLGRTIEFLEQCWRKRRNTKKETEQTNAKMKQILKNFTDCKHLSDRHKEGRKITFYHLHMFEEINTCKHTHTHTHTLSPTHTHTYPHTHLHSPKSLPTY